MGNLDEVEFSVSSPDWCQHHAVAATQCGGPHRVVRTDLGDELLAPQEQPVGTPIAEMSEQEQKEHMEAVESARGKGDGDRDSGTPGP